MAEANCEASSRRGLSLGEAATLAQQIASDADIRPDGLVINELTDTDAACTRVHVTVAGRIEVHLHGPQTTR